MTSATPSVPFAGPSEGHPAPRAGEPPRTNEDWLRALAQGGAAAEAAHRDLRVVLIRGLRRMLSTRGVTESLCEDIAQEALLRVRARLAAFRGESRFTTWALSIATRIAFDDLRHKHWKDVSFEVTTADARGPLAFEPIADAPQEKAIVRDRVLAALHMAIAQGLTERQRTVLVAELNGMPHSEIARMLGTNRNALYKLGHDARRRVRSQLEAAGISETDVLWVFQ